MTAVARPVGAGLGASASPPALANENPMISTATIDTTATSKRKKRLLRQAFTTWEFRAAGCRHMEARLQYDRQPINRERVSVWISA